MRFTIFFCFLSFGILYAAAQSPADSLKAAYHQVSTKAERAEILRAICAEYRGQGKLNRDSLRIYSLALLEVLKGEELSEIYFEAKTNYLIASYRLPYPEYAVIAKDLISDYRAVGNVKQELTELYYLALKAHTAGHEEAELLYKDGLQKLEENQASLGADYARLKIKYRNSLSAHYENRGLYKQALSNLFQTIEEAEEQGDSVHIMLSYKTAGAVIGKMAESMDYSIPEWTTAKGRLEEFLTKTYHLSKDLGDDSNFSLAAYNLAYYYYSLDSLDLARKYVAQSSSVADIEWMQRQAYFNKLLQSDIARKEGHWEQSLNFLKEGMQKAQELNEPRFDFLSTMDAVNWYFDYGAYETAHEYLSQLENSMPNNLELRRAYYEKAYQLDEKLGHTSTVLHHFKQYNTLSDSLENMSQANQIAALMSQFDLAEAEKEMALLESENLRTSLRFQRTVFSLGLGLVLLFAFGFYLFQKEKKKQLVYEKKQIELEQQLFRVMMNPHFIFNTLGSIQGLLLTKNKSEEASYFLTKFSKLMRQILSQSQRTYISLKEELDTLKNYLLIQQFRFDNRFEYDIILPPNLDVEDYKIPPMLLQPIVENAIEHGQVYSQANGRISISFEEDDHFLRVKIVDNGVGLEAAKKKAAALEKTSTALNIVKKRLKHAQKQFGEQVGFSLLSEKEGGTCASLVLPKLN